MYNSESWLVNGKPGTGETPLERLLSIIFGCWYLASSLPVVLAYLSDNDIARKFTILCPIIYHVLISIIFFLFAGSWNVCNTEVVSPNSAGIIHALLAAICVVLYKC